MLWWRHDSVDGGEGAVRLADVFFMFVENSGALWCHTGRIIPVSRCIHCRVWSFRWICLHQERKNFSFKDLSRHVTCSQSCNQRDYWNCSTIAVFFIYFHITLPCLSYKGVDTNVRLRFFQFVPHVGETLPDVKSEARVLCLAWEEKPPAPARPGVLQRRLRRLQRQPGSFHVSSNQMLHFCVFF